MQKERNLVNKVTSVLLGLLSVGFVSAAPTVQSILNSWADAGIFKYVLPFLLVFALIFGILSKTAILGDNKGVHAIIAAALGLMSLVGDYFPNFLEKFAPNVATAVSVLLCIIILLGLFYNHENKNGVKWIIYVFIGIGIIAFLFVLGDTFSGYSGVGFNVWEDYGPALITLLIIGGIVAAIIAGGKKSS
jgi:hypothetical protein